MDRKSVRRHRDAGHHKPAEAHDGAVVDLGKVTVPVDAKPPEVPLSKPEHPWDDAELLALVAEQAEEAPHTGTIATRERKGAKRSALELRRGEARQKLAWLWGKIQFYLEEADAVGEDGPDNSGRAKLVSACTGVLRLIGEILGELDPATARAHGHVDAILEVLEMPEHADAAKAVLVRLEALEKRG